MSVACARVVTVEDEMARDAIAELGRAYDALEHRHGAAFRQLERDIEAYCQDKAQPASEAHQLVGPVVVLAPAAPLRALIARAKAMGVI